MLRLAGPRVMRVIAPPLLGALCVPLLACGGGSAPADSSCARSTYGCGLTGSSAVAYQPDVVLVGGGPQAVRSRSADGMTWTIKGDAAKADQLAPGKIMFVTGFGVGRILAVRADGRDRMVTLGPVNLTDVIREADIASSRPISLDHVLAYAAPQLPGTYAAEPNPSPSPTADAVDLPAIELVAGDAMPPPTSTPAQIGVGSFGITPYCCSGGVGAHLTYDAGGLRMIGNVGFHFTTPSVTFHLVIHGAKLITAALEISGAGGVALQFNGATQSGIEGNVNRTLHVPVDLTVPIFGLPIPFSATVQQWFIVRTAFSAKDSTLSAAGDFSFGGKLGFGYQNGSFGAVFSPTGFGVTKSLADSITGLSVGVAGLVLSYQARFGVGIGAFGFMAGLWYMITSAFGITNGSSLGAPLARCHSASLDLTARYGVGYNIPQVAADLVNLFLKVFQARPIQATGGVFATSNILHRAETVPNVSICTGG